MHLGVNVRSALLAIAAVVAGTAFAGEPDRLPTYIANLVNGRLLNSPTVDGSVLQLKTSPDFDALTPASKAEVCRIVAEYYSTAKGIHKVIVIDPTNRVVQSCE